MKISTLIAVLLLMLSLVHVARGQEEKHAEKMGPGNPVSVIGVGLEVALQGGNITNNLFKSLAHGDNCPRSPQYFYAEQCAPEHPQSYVAAAVGIVKQLVRGEMTGDQFRGSQENRYALNHFLHCSTLISDLCGLDSGPPQCQGEFYALLFSAVSLASPETGYILFNTHQKTVRHIMKNWKERTIAGDFPFKENWVTSFLGMSSEEFRSGFRERVRSTYVARMNQIDELEKVDEQKDQYFIQTMPLSVFGYSLARTWSTGAIKQRDQEPAKLVDAFVNRTDFTNYQPPGFFEPPRIQPQAQVKGLDAMRAIKISESMWLNTPENVSPWQSGELGFTDDCGSDPSCS